MANEATAIARDQRAEHDHPAPAAADREEDAGPGAAGPSLQEAGDATARRIARKGGKKTADGADLTDGTQVAARLAELLATPGAVDQLKPAERKAIAMNPPPTLDDAAKAGLKLVFDHTPDGELDTLKKLIGARFRIDTVGKDKDKGSPDWDAAGLRRTWSVLEQLPPAHVEGNASIYSLVRYKTDKKTAAEGYFEDVDDNENTVNEVAIAYTPGKLDAVDKGDFTDKQDPMYGLNVFNGTVRHEIGHAVDAQGKFSDKYCIDNSAGGNWRSYDDGYDKVLADMVALSPGGIAGSSQKEAILAELAKIMKQQKFDKMEKLLGAAPFWSKLSAAEQKDVLADPIVKVLGHNTTANEPWMDGNGGVALGGRIFQESYDQSWTSYAAEARDRKVSKYQFSAPGEWFAEAYACYYEPPTGKAPLGSLLDKSDPKAKEFFDLNVATMGASKGDAKETKKPKAKA